MSPQACSWWTRPRCGGLAVRGKRKWPAGHSSRYFASDGNERLKDTMLRTKQWCREATAQAYPLRDSNAVSRLPWGTRQGVRLGTHIVRLTWVSGPCSGTVSAIDFEQIRGFEGMDLPVDGSGRRRGLAQLHGEGRSHRCPLGPVKWMWWMTVSQPKHISPFAFRCQQAADARHSVLEHLVLAAEVKVANFDRGW